MPTSSFTDADFGVRSLGDRTDAAGLAVSDLSAREDALVNHALTAGVIKPDNAFRVTADGASMTLTVGSGAAYQDLAVVESEQAQQPPYLVRLNDVSVSVALDASGASSRTDQIYLVVEDATWDGLGRSLARVGYRKGDAGAGPPGPDAGWSAYLLLATVTVAGGAVTVAQADVSDGRVQSTLLDRLISGTFARDADLDAHTGATNPHSGSASTAALNTHTGSPSAHGAATAASPDRIVLRDAAGRAKIAAPATADDIARKDTVDGAVTSHAGGTAHVANVSTATLPGSVPNGLTYVQPNAANNPEGTAGGIGLCTKSAGYVMQIFSHTNGNTYTRFGESTANTWQAWRRIDNL